jgi:MFS family permease
VVGGLIVQSLGWRWIFAIYPPLAAAAFLLIATTLRLPRPAKRPAIDYAGAITLAAAVVGVVLLGQTRQLAWLILIIAAGAAWLITTRFAADPILPLRLFSDAGFAIPVTISFLIGFALFGTLTYLPAYLQVALGLPASQAGLVVTALMAGVLITTVLSGRLITKTGRYKAYPVAGTAIAAAGLAVLAVMASDTGAHAITAVMAVIGLGVGLVMQVMVLAAQNAVVYDDLGTATSTVTFLRQIGASAGVAVAGAVITARLSHQVPAAVAFSQAVPIVFGLMAPLLVMAFVLAIALPNRPLRATSYVEEMETA